MRLPRVPPAFGALPLWPPLLATRGAGAKSAPHAHHAMHVVLAIDGQLEVAFDGHTITAAGVLTGPDVRHAVDASEVEVLIVFLDPESDAGSALHAVLEGGARAITDAERDALVIDADALRMMTSDTDWPHRAARVLGGAANPARRRRIHPRVKKLLRLLPAAEDTSLEALADSVGLSPGRLMHVFTESIGVPLRPYLAWLRVQRAAGAIASNVPLGDAAHAAGFSDAAHMTRTFRRMLGATPSALRPRP